MNDYLRNDNAAPNRPSDDSESKEIAHSAKNDGQPVQELSDQSQDSDDHTVCLDPTTETETELSAAGRVHGRTQMMRRDDDAASMIVTYNPYLIIVVALCARYAPEVEANAPGALKGLFRVAIHNSIEKFVDTFRKNARIKDFKPSAMTSHVLSYITDKCFDDVLDILGYYFDRCRIDDVLREEDKTEVIAVAGSIVDAYNANSGVINEKTARLINTEAAVRLNKLAPVAKMVRLALAEIGILFSKISFEAVLDAYKVLCGKDVPKTMLERDIKAAIAAIRKTAASQRPSADQMDEVRQSLRVELAMGAVPKYIIGITNEQFLEVYFHGKEPMLRAILSAAATVYTLYDYNGNIRRTGEKKNSIFQRSKKNRELILFLKDKDYDCQALLDYTVGGLARMGIIVPMSYYSYAKHEFEATGILQMKVADAIDLHTGGTFRGRSGVEGHTSYTEAGNAKINKKIESFFKKDNPKTQ